MFEAQLGALRDIEFGIYPYTSSSCTLAGYATIGAGIPGLKLDKTIGIMKAYSSCVGEGPFTVEMFGGGKTDLAELKGKVVLLNFWATWCPPCRQELARVQSDVIDRFAGRDFVFLPISRGETHQTVAAFREKTGYSFPMGLDPSQTVYDRYASNYIPRNFVIDRNGKVVLASVGYDPEEFDEMIKTIEKILE